MKDVIKGADVFMGLSVPGVIDEQDVKQMTAQPIVFAMANPTPEIMPEEAAPHVEMMATGRSDYPNQINNVFVSREYFAARWPAVLRQSMKK